MRYIPLENKVYIQNRKKFTKNLKSSSIAIFNSNDIMPTSADGTMPFRQQTDLLYLTGIDQEESILLLFPDANEKDGSENSASLPNGLFQRSAAWTTCSPMSPSPPPITTPC